jgi:hypothetical protein
LSLGFWPRVSATGILMCFWLIIIKIWGPNRLHPRLGELPQQRCLYPEVILKEYIVVRCQCSKALRQKIPFQKKVWLMKPHKSCGSWSYFRNHTIQIKEVSFSTSSLTCSCSYFCTISTFSSLFFL